MKFVGSRKLTWGICSIGILLALVGVFFLPQIIPMHFANGIPDGFGNKIEIFLFPILLLMITILTGKEKIKYILTHSKVFLTDTQCLFKSFRGINFEFRKIKGGFHNG